MTTPDAGLVEAVEAHVTAEPETQQLTEEVAPRTGAADDRGSGGEDPYDVGAAPYFFVEPFLGGLTRQRSCRPTSVTVDSAVCALATV